MDDIYREHILDHYRNPRNFGELPGADVVVRENNASCGDKITMALKLKTENGKSKIVKVKFTGVGCAISMAATSLLTEKIMNHELGIREIKQMAEKDMEKLLGIVLSPGRIKCATLPLVAVRKAL